MGMVNNRLQKLTRTLGQIECYLLFWGVLTSPNTMCICPNWEKNDVEVTSGEEHDERDSQLHSKRNQRLDNTENKAGQVEMKLKESPYGNAHRCLEIQPLIVSQ